MEVVAPVVDLGNDHFVEIAGLHFGGFSLPLGGRYLFLLEFEAGVYKKERN